MLPVAAIIFGLLVFSFVFAVGATLLVPAGMLAAVVGVLSLVQLLLGWIAEHVAGKRPKWLFSPAVWVLECVLAVLLFGMWYTAPARLDLPVRDCALVGVATSATGRIKVTLTEQEKIEGIVEVLEPQPLGRRINIRFLNEGTIDGTDGFFLSFFNEEQERILKVRILGDYIGVTRRKDPYPNECYVYYRVGDEVDLSQLYEIVGKVPYE